MTDEPRDFRTSGGFPKQPDFRTGARLARLAMRTRFEVVIADDGDPAALRAAGEEALDEVTAAESLLSAHQDGAELRQLNLMAGTAVVPLSPLMHRFLRQCCALVEATDGTFDPAVGALIDCWRLQGEGDAHTEPSPEAIADALKATDLRRQLRLDPQERFVQFAHTTTRLDPGAVGKGWALDRAEARLRDAGIRNALIHGGTSTANAIGDGPDHDGWRIAIRDPRTDDGVLAQARLQDQSLSVSGQHGRTTAVGGRTIGHILDPRSGRPVDHTSLAAVIHPSAMISDALSTALLVLGHGGIATLAKRFPGSQFLLLASNGTTLTHGEMFQ
jgi:thiamine biosynthesis lipoprotein